MAKVIVDTNLSDIPYASNEVIDVGQGATLTIDSDTVVTPGSIRVIDNTANDVDLDGRGTILLENTSTTTPIIFTFQSANDDFRVEASGLFKVRGNWITVLTSNGTASQTVDMSNIGGKSIDHPSLIEVETGSGTGVFECFPVVNINAVSGTARSRTDFGSGDTGKVVFYDAVNQTLEFGDGTNGFIPLTGAIVRMPNIHITSAGTASSNTSRSSLDLNPGGSCDIEICQFSDNFYLNAAICGNVRMSHVGCISRAIINQSVGNAELEYISVGYDPRDLTPGSSGLTVVFGNVTIDNYYCVNYQQNAFILSVVPSLQSVTNVRAFVLDRDSATSDAAINFTNTSNTATYNNLTAIGCCLRIVNLGPAFIQNVKYSDQCNGIVNTAINTSIIRTTNSNGTVITGIRLADGGAAPRDYICQDDNQSSNLLINDVVVDMQSHGRYIVAYNGVNNTYSNFNLSNLSNAVSDNIQDGPGAGATYKNILATYDGTGRAQQGSGARFEFVQLVNDINASLFPAYVDGGQFQVLVDNPASTGTVQIGPFGAESVQDPYDFVVGNPGFNANGGMILSVGDQVIFKSQESIRSVTSLQNVDPTFNFTGVATWEYELVQSGEAFTDTWAAFTGANLNAETITDSDIGFDMRIRATCTTAGILRAIRFLTSNDSSYQSTDATITLQGANATDVVELRLLSDDSLIATFTGSGEKAFPVGSNLFEDAYLVRKNSSNVEIMRTQVDPINLRFGTNGVVSLFSGAEVQLAQSPIVEENLDAAISTLETEISAATRKSDTDSKLTTINDGVKNASILVPHDGDLT